RVNDHIDANNDLKESGKRQESVDSRVKAKADRKRRERSAPKDQKKRHSTIMRVQRLHQYHLPKEDKQIRGRNTSLSYSSPYSQIF
ncbi:hypothetical protein SK128_019617, partial [Halocaridina rubra]